MKKYADVRVTLIVSFEDNEDLELEWQAVEAATNMLGIMPDDVASIDVIGKVRDTVDPS